MLIVSIMQNITIFIVKLYVVSKLLSIKHQRTSLPRKNCKSSNPYMKSLKALVCVLTVVESNDSSYCIKFVDNLSLSKPVDYSTECNDDCSISDM